MLGVCDCAPAHLKNRIADLAVEASKILQTSAASAGRG